MRKDQLRRSLGGSKSLDLVVLKADGDCFYDGLARALGSETTIESLRSYVAAFMTEEMFENYKAVSFVEGFEWATRCSNLEELRREIEKPKLVWADENALAALAGSIVRLLILDEEGTIPSSKYLSLGFTEAAEENQLPIILLTRSRRQHFNIATWDGSLTFGNKVSELPPPIRDLFFPSESTEAKTTTNVKKRNRDDS